MLTPRLTNCPECADIPNLLKRIDCKLADYANGLYNNIVFMLNRVVSAGTMIQLLAYKRILTYKQCNPDYLADCCMDKIVSKVVRLTSDCYIVPTVPIVPIISTTTTTTTRLTSSTTTTTSTTFSPSNCSFNGIATSNCSFNGNASSGCSFKGSAQEITTTTTTTTLS